MAGHENMTEVRTVTIADTTAPIFTSIPVNTTIIYGEDFPGVTFSADDDGVGDLSWFINWTDTFSIVPFFGFLDNTSSLAAGNYSINVSVNDTVGNVNLFKDDEDNTSDKKELFITCPKCNNKGWKHGTSSMGSKDFAHSLASSITGGHGTLDKKGESKANQSNPVVYNKIKAKGKYGRVHENRKTETNSK